MKVTYHFQGRKIATDETGSVPTKQDTVIVERVIYGIANIVRYPTLRVVCVELVMEPPAIQAIADTYTKP